MRETPRVHLRGRAVYEPQEDSYLLLDAMELVAAALPAFPCVLDVGTGSGIAAAFAHALTDGRALVFATDANPQAVQTCRETCSQVHALRTDLAGGLRGGQWDLVLFNPPYVPSADLHCSHPLELAWKGGLHGVEVMARFLQTQLPALLAPNGRLLLVVERENGMQRVLDLLPAFQVETLLARRCGREFLYVLSVSARLESSACSSCPSPSPSSCSPSSCSCSSTPSCHRLGLHLLGLHAVVHQQRVERQGVGQDDLPDGAASDGHVLQHERRAARLAAAGQLDIAQAGVHLHVHGGHSPVHDAAVLELDRDALVGELHEETYQFHDGQYDNLTRPDRMHQMDQQDTKGHESRSAGRMLFDVPPATLHRWTHLCLGALCTTLLALSLATHSLHAYVLLLLALLFWALLAWFMVYVT